MGHTWGRGRLCPKTPLGEHYLQPKEAKLFTSSHIISNNNIKKKNPGHTQINPTKEKLFHMESRNPGGIYAENREEASVGN